METNTRNNGAHTKNGVAKNNRPNLPLNGEGKSEPGAESRQEPENGNAKAAEQNPPPAKDLPEMPKPKPEQPTAATSEHHNAGEAEPARPVLTLDAKLKAVDTLYRKSIQRNNLIARMKQLEEFDVALARENDELEDNPYQGCKLIIEDDKKRQFVTTTPGLIRLVSQFIFDACNQKREEIEAAIVFPNA